jgi:hypothetical protein
MMQADAVGEACHNVGIPYVRLVVYRAVAERLETNSWRDVDDTLQYAMNE